jgi:cell division topological specificity factor
MFDNIIKFLKKFNKKEDKALANSKDAAKERLHLVLMQDRANVSADFLELMKQEIIDVIKKYIDVDENAIDVRLTNKENADGTNGAPALYANIPIVNIKNDARKIEKKEEEKLEQKENEQKQKEQAKKEQVAENSKETETEKEEKLQEKNQKSDANSSKQKQENKEVQKNTEKEVKKEKQENNNKTKEKEQTKKEQENEKNEENSTEKVKSM